VIELITALEYAFLSDVDEILVI